MSELFVGGDRKTGRKSYCHSTEVLVCFDRMKIGVSDLNGTNSRQTVRCRRDERKKKEILIGPIENVDATQLFNVKLISKYIYIKFLQSVGILTMFAK